MLSRKVHEEQKAALMTATVQAVVQHGVENVTTRNISALCGVKEIYIYRYFENKDSLLAQTFAYADEQFLNTMLNHFPVMHYESVDYITRCRYLFEKCWDYVLAHPDWLIFYVRYYYSSSFQKYAYEGHMKRYEIMIERMRPACHPTADVKTVLHHILDTLLGQARKQITHPGDLERVTDDAFWLLFSVLKCGKGI